LSFWQLIPFFGIKDNLFHTLLRNVTSHVTRDRHTSKTVTTIFWKLLVVLHFHEWKLA
jgi:hypothetical protein